MANTKILSLVVSQFTQRKLRSALTIIGIMIGISALVSLIMLSSALKEGVTSFTSSFGTDSILLAPRAASGSGAPSGFGIISMDDVKVIEAIPQVRKVNYYLQSTRAVDFGRQTFRFPILGYPIDTDYSTFIQQDLLAGRFLVSTDSNSVNIGYNIAKKVFDKEIAVNSFIKINGTKYRVVGIFAEKGDQASDTQIITNIEDLRHVVGDQKAVTAMDIRITSGSDIDVVNQRIIDVLKRYRGQKDFSTITPAKLKETIGSLLGVIDIIVISIASISLFVGALGIMNSLYTSVLQRTKEIGTMKAVGATNAQILVIFLIESAILGLLGGIVGVLAGLLMAYAFVIPLNIMGIIKFIITPDMNLIIGSIIFSVVLGMLAGFLPAYRASRLKPVDALRYE